MEYQVICDRKRAFKIVRRSLIRVDSYKKIDKYLKKAHRKDFQLRVKTPSK